MIIYGVTGSFFSDVRNKTTKIQKHSPEESQMLLSDSLYSNTPFILRNCLLTRKFNEYLNIYYQFLLELYIVYLYRISAIYIVIYTYRVHV